MTRAPVAYRVDWRAPDGACGHAMVEWRCDLDGAYRRARRSVRDAHPGATVAVAVACRVCARSIELCAGHRPPMLTRYADAVELRPATRAETVASRVAARSDGGAGVIMADGVACYVAE